MTSRDHLIDAHFKIFYGGSGQIGFHELEIEFDFNYEYTLLTSAIVNPYGINCRKVFNCFRKKFSHLIIDNDSTNMI